MNATFKMFFYIEFSSVKAIFGKWIFCHAKQKENTQLNIFINMHFFVGIVLFFF